MPGTPLRPIISNKSTRIILKPFKREVIFDRHLTDHKNKD